MKTFGDMELLYSAESRCICGAGMAYPLDNDEAMKLQAWCCSRVLKGESPEKGNGHERCPWAFYKIREETSINNRSAATTRPAGTAAKTVGHAKCGACGHEWESEPYQACGASHHWFPGACPKCGNDHGGNGGGSSTDTRPRIETRYRTVVLVP